MTEPAAPVRVVIADDHPMYRYGLRAVLAESTAVTLVGEATSGRQLLELVPTLRPDVVVTDLHMPDVDGVSAAAQLAAAEHPPAVLVLTMHDDDESVFAAMRAGARGYLLKGVDGAELVGTILALSRGETVFGPSVARRIVGFFLESHGRFTTGAFPGLTSREREVLDLLASGARNVDIANRLGIADKTVRNTLSSIFTKLQVSDRGAAIVRARQAGLGRTS